MKNIGTPFLKKLRLIGFIGLATACTVLSAYADEYGDASQLVRANKFAEALTKVESYLVTKPSDPQMRFLKGVILRNLGKSNEAITTFVKLTEDFPELPEPHNNLAVLYAGQGQYDKARVALEMAIRTNPSYATAHENIGDVYARLASQAYNKALQLDSANMAVPPKLALIRELFNPNLANARPMSVAATEPDAPAVAPVTRPVGTPPAATVATVPPPTVALSAAKPGVTVAPRVVVPSPTVVNADPTKAIEAAVQAWAQAWSAKDVDRYLAAYSPDFVPMGRHHNSHSAWAQDRRARIVGKTHISVKVSSLHINVKADTATAKFRQAYRADALSVSSQKNLVLQRVNGQWLITQESTGN